MLVTASRERTRKIAAERNGPSTTLFCMVKKLADDGVTSLLLMRNGRLYNVSRAAHLGATLGLDALERFLLNRSDEKELDLIESHLLSCEEFVTRLEGRLTTTDDAFAVSTIPGLLAHATDTFGSETAAKEWLSIECGALNNQSPTDFINKTGNVTDVERILNCIDHGMIA